MKQLHILALALAFAQAGTAQTHEELVIDGGFEVYVKPQNGNEGSGEGGTAPTSNPSIGISTHRCRANARKRHTAATTPYAFSPMAGRSSHAIKTSTHII